MTGAEREMDDRFVIIERTAGIHDEAISAERVTLGSLRTDFPWLYRQLHRPGVSRVRWAPPDPKSLTKFRATFAPKEGSNDDTPDLPAPDA